MVSNLSLKFSPNRWTNDAKQYWKKKIAQLNDRRDGPPRLSSVEDILNQDCLLEETPYMRLTFLAGTYERNG